MSEVYLTKIERKTIFTKSLIFVLIVVIISDLTVTGPFWFNFIPWMFILGVVGSIKKIDSVLMCVIGTFNVFVSSTIMAGGIHLDGILTTVITLVNLILGIITGRICFEFILEHRLVKYIRRSKKIMYIATMIVMFFVSYVIVALSSGNVIAYLKSKANLEQYITSTYNTEDFDVIKVEYNKYVPGKYTYKVNINEQQVKFVPITKNIFKDYNKDSRYISMQHDLEKETAGKMQEVLEKYPLIQDATVKFKIDYPQFAINSKIIKLEFEYNKDIADSENVDELYEQMVNCIKELQNIKKSEIIIITVNGNTLQLPYKNLELLTVDYIKGGFEIEEISE